MIGGTVLGRVGRPDPARRRPPRLRDPPRRQGAPLIDPKPILDGWKLLEATAIYRASGRNALYGDGDGFSIGQILLMPKPLLERRVLSDERIEIYDCGRDDIRSGQIDRRVLATLAYLAESGLQPDRHEPQVRPRLPHRFRQRVPPLVGQRGGHRRRSTASRSSATRRPAASPSRPCAG